MAQPDDAPLDRTSAAVTKADLFDTAQWLDRRVGSVRTELSEMAAGSGEITERIMGDLAGIRAEQMHLARRLDMLGAELRMDIRKELRSTGEERVADGSSGASRLARVLMGFLVMVTLAGILAVLTLVLLPVLGLQDVLPQGWTTWLDRRGE